MFSIICHIIYLQNFSNTWPVISLSTPSFIASCTLVIVDHFLWFFHFARISQDAQHQRTYRGAPTPNVPGFTEIATFFGTCVWLAPLFLFLSLSANDNALPTGNYSLLHPLSHSSSSFLPCMSADPGTPTSSPTQFSQSRVSLFRSILSFDFIPRMRQKPSRRDTSEGIIAPRSPVPPRSPLPPSSPTVGSRYTSQPSPGLQNNVYELDTHLPPSSSFKLGTPPRRSMPVHRPTGEAVGLGLRRIPSSSIMGE
jgi:hypothetical protein